MISALEQGDLEGVAHRLYNVFEDVLPRKYAQVFEIKRSLLDLGAMARLHDRQRAHGLRPVPG